MLRRIYRVHAWLEEASSGEPGHPLYIYPYQGRNRIDNPDEYLALYVAETPAGAVGEVFGDHAIWTDDLLLGPSSLPGSVRALSSYDADVSILDLDDPKALLDRGLRPSRIVTRHRALTQAWASAIFSEGSADGLRWWSYHEPDWGSIGLWNYNKLAHVAVTPLSSSHTAVVEARRLLNRSWR